jgi:hypothetical protein
MGEIRLTNGLVVLVDDEDLPRLLQFKWGPLCGGKYARTTKKTDTGRQESMHRMVLCTPLDVDHINGNGLDNRKCNLRAATESQNLHNRGPQRNNTSGVKGVSWSAQRRRWVAFCRINKKDHRKRFERLEDAVAWRMSVAAGVGEFARHT